MSSWDSTAPSSFYQRSSHAPKMHLSHTTTTYSTYLSSLYIPVTGMGQDYSANPDICNFLSNLNLTRTEEPAENPPAPPARKIEYPATMSGILTKKTLSLAIADEIATFAIQACKSNGFKPISICVMDPSGYEIVTKRMDGCPVSIPFSLKRIT